MEIAREGHSYATRAGAVTALDRAIAPRTKDEPAVRWAIIAAADGRFVPALFGAEWIPVAFSGKVSVIA